MSFTYTDDGTYILVLRKLDFHFWLLRQKILLGFWSVCMFEYLHMPRCVNINVGMLVYTEGVIPFCTLFSKEINCKKQMPGTADSSVFPLLPLSSNSILLPATEADRVIFAIYHSLSRKMKFTSCCLRTALC